METIVILLLGLLTLAAIGYTVSAMFAARAFARSARPAPVAPEPVTLLKPLHGHEPRLAENLASFFAQDWPAPIQLVVGVNRNDDAALPVARGLVGDVVVTVDAPEIGANAKIDNLANMIRAAEHDLLVLSDSDIAVPRDYLVRVAAALALPGVGAVTCLYRGRGDAGGWSRFAAAAIDWQFTPSVLMSVATRADHPCMGSTIALRRGTLDAIGGFAAFADLLADDYAIGAAVRRLGLGVEVVPGLVVTHGCAETSLAALWSHELRWAATVRGVTGPRYAGVLLTHPLPLALLIVPWWPLTGVSLVGLALLTRLLLARAMAAMADGSPAPRWWLPARDIMSFAVYGASFFARSVDWRGSRLHMASAGRIAAPTEID